MAKILFGKFGGARASIKRRTKITGLVTAIELDGLQLRVVQGESQGAECRIKRIETGEIVLAADEKSDPAAAGRAISKALAQWNLKPGGPVIMGLPRGQVVLRTLALPGVEDTSALAGMVHFQVAKDLPFRVDDAVIDFRVCGLRDEPPVIPPGAAGNAPETESVAKVEVLVAAVKKEVADFYSLAAEAAGLQLTALGLLSYANVRCLEACKVAEPGQTMALVSVRHGEVGVDVIGHQTLLFSRNGILKQYEEGEEPPSVPAVPAEPPANGEAEPQPPKAEKKSFEELAAIEVVRSLHSFASGHGGKPPGSVVVTGSTGLEGKIVELLGHRLPVPCSGLEIGAALGFPPETRALADGAIGPIGLAISSLDPDGLPFDFLNPKKPAIQRDYRKVRAIGIAAGIALLLAGALGIRSHLIQKRLAAQKQWQTELDGLEKQRTIFRKMIQQGRVVDDWAKGGKSWLTHYAYLSEVLPPSEEVYITSISVGGNGTIRLTVQAQSGEILAKMEKQLRAAGYEVKPVAITPGADRFGYDFRSGMDLVVPEKLKIDLAKTKAPARPGDDVSLDPAMMKRGGG